MRKPLPTLAPAGHGAGRTSGSTRETVDAVVIGAGPNGLVAANALADAGWDVLLLEANEVVGGAVRSAEVAAPGFSTDLFSAFYPLAAASRVIQDLDLADHGLRWVQAPTVLAHPLAGGACAVLSRRPEDTAAGLEAEAAGDGQAWLDMFAQWRRIRDPLLEALFTPFPPVKSAFGLLRKLHVAGAVDLARLAVLPVRRLAEEHFAGDQAALLLTGNAMHSDVPPDAAGSGVFGWLLAMLAQDVGFPVPQGGAQSLADSLRRRFESRGGQVRTGARVSSVVISNGVAVGVRLADGSTIRSRRAVLADVVAPTLYRDLVGLAQLPPAFGRSVDRFQWDSATVKVNWALSQPIPWSSHGARGAGTVHLGVDVDGFVDFGADLSTGRTPQSPFMLLGQMTTADPTRSPAGTESVWSYTHVPQSVPMAGAALAAHVDRMQTQIAALAPGFEELIVGRHIQGPADMQKENISLVDGAINGGTSYPHQQLFFRPTPGLGRPETPIAKLFLASSSAHPGGGVHGACGWNAALSAVKSDGWKAGPRRILTKTAWGRLLRD